VSVGFSQDAGRFFGEAWEEEGSAARSQQKRGRQAAPGTQDPVSLQGTSTASFAAQSHPPFLFAKGFKVSFWGGLSVLSTRTEVLSWESCRFHCFSEQQLFFLSLIYKLLLFGVFMTKIASSGNQQWFLLSGAQPRERGKRVSHSKGLFMETSISLLCPSKVRYL